MRTVGYRGPKRVYALGETLFSIQQRHDLVSVARCPFLLQPVDFALHFGPLPHVTQAAQFADTVPRSEGGRVGLTADLVDQPGFSFI
jgi:hypothetical protein